DDPSRQTHPMIWSEWVALVETGLVHRCDPIGVEDDEVGVAAGADTALAVADTRQLSRCFSQPPSQIGEVEASAPGTVPGGHQTQLERGDPTPGGEEI